MDNFKRNYLKRTLSLLLAVIMIITLAPLGVFAQEPGISTHPDALTGATYYTKPNWEARIRDRSRWKVEDTQTLVRVGGADPLQMNDIDYDGMFINANGRYVIRLIYKEKSQAISAVWYRALINFGDLDKYIDFSNSYVLGRDGKTRYTFDPVTGIKGRGFDLGRAVGDRTNNRKNLPINLVLKDGITLKTLPKDNYIVQMRVTNSDYTRVYAYAPKGTSMDYSTYTKTTSVSFLDNLNNLFIKGGMQEDSNNATNQEFFMSEFIANPDQYKDTSNIGIIRTQYMGQRAGSDASPTVGGEPIAFTQVFDANLLNYLKEDDAGNVAYTNLLTVNRLESPYAHKIGIKKTDINEISVEGGQKLAYVVLAPEAFQKDGVKVVKTPQHDQYTMLSGFYITAIDYLVDKGKFEDTFSEGHTRKLNYSTMSGWTNPNDEGWVVYTKSFENDFVVQEGDSFMVDAGAAAKGKQIMIQVGGEQAILRKPQGYYNGYNFNKAAIDNFEEIADGVFKFTIGEGTTVLKEKKLKIYMPYTSSYNDEINFLEIHNGTKLNEGAAALTLEKDRNINMHLYKQGKKGHFVLKYTLANGTESSLTFTPKILWKYTDSDNVLTGAANTATVASGGNFYIDTTKLKPGTDIIVESYDDKGNKVDSETSWFKYVKATKSTETVKLLTWTDHSDKRSVLSINKSLYTPYQVLFTNDYADGVDDFYKNPRVLPTDNNKFNTETTKIIGYTKYDSGKVRTLYEGPQMLYGKVEAASDEYDDKGNLTKDNHTDVNIAKKDLFDAQFAEDSKTYKAYEYTFDLNKMLPYHSDDKTETKLTLLKDMKFVSTASDGSSLPSDLFESRVRARVLFDTTEGAWADNTNKAVKIVPDNFKFYGEDGYVANGFEGEGADTNTGDKFPEAPKSGTKTFLGWVTEDGKTALGKTTVTTAEFNALNKDKVFTNTTPVEKHLVVYAIYTNDKVVTFDANGGKFQDGKDEMNKQSSDLANVEVPKREGYTFKGWAATKDATEPTDGILDNVTESKTVYAVWEQEADKKLELTPPTLVDVQDKTDLTEVEKDKVKQAVIDANPTLNLSKDDITVGSDGKVTVKTKDGKTGELTPDETVKQKEVINNINPPEEPIEVKNKEALTEEEKGKVRDAIIKANPDLNLKPNEITVGNDGTVTINQGGKTGNVPADKTVVEESKVIKLNKPTPVEVKDINNLTAEEKEAVKDAVIAANSGLTKDKITVDGNGNVIVTDGDKMGKLDGTDTVKPFDRTGKTFNENIEITEVSDKNNLTEAEKEAVREAVKAANPDLNFKDEEIQVDDDGKVTVPMGNETKTIDPSKTVKEDNKNTTISLKAPKVTPVVDPTSLTQAEKDAVKAAVIKANPDIATGYEITVANDGSVMVTSGNKMGILSAADTVVKKLDPPKIASDEEGNVKILHKDDRTKEIEVTYTDANNAGQTITAKKENGEWKLVPEVDGVTIDKDSGLISIPADKIKNGTDVKAVAKDGENTSDEANTISADTKAPDAPELNQNDDGSVTITPPADKDTSKLTIKYTDANGTPKEFVVEKSGDNWTIPADAPEGTTLVDGKITIPADKIKPGTRVSAQAEDGNGNKSSEPGITTKTTADKIEPNIPAKIKVGDKAGLTEDEKTAVKTAIENANKDGSGTSTLPEGTEITVGDDGTATIKYPDGSIDTIKGTSLVEEKTQAEKIEPTVPAKTNVINKDNLTQAEKDAVKKAIEDANKEKFPTPNEGQEATKVEIANDGTATIIYPDGSVDTISGTDLVEQDATLPKEPTVTAKDDGSVEITPAADDDSTKSIEVTYIPEGQTVPVTIKAKKDNTGWVFEGTVDEEITIDTTGKITIPENKVKDSSDVTAVAKNEAGDKTSAKSTAKIKSTADITDPTKLTEKVKVGNPSNLTEEEQNAVKKAIEEANKTKFPAGTKVDVDNTGKATITYPDGSKNTIEASDLVEEKADDDKTQADNYDPIVPAKTKVIDPANLTQDEKDAVKKAIEDANKDKFPTPTAGQNPTKVEVAAGGTATITYPDGSVDTIKGSDLTEQKTTPGEDKIKAPTTPVEVKDPSNLTPEEKEAVKKAVKDANPTLKDDQIKVNDDGSVTVTDANGKTIGTLTPAQTVKKAGTPTPSYDDIIYPDTDIYVGDNVNIYPLGNYGNYIESHDLQAPRGVRVKANLDGSINVEVSPDYRGPSEFYIDGYAYVNGKSVPIRIRIRAIDDAYARYRYESRRIRRDRRYDREEKEEEREEVDTREIHIHKAYIYGYTDGTVRPNGFITRAEAAAMLSRLLEDENTASALKPAFSDTPSKWYNKAINAVVARGIMRGYSDGTFRPNAPITRAEFAQMISAIDAKPFGTAPFADVKGHWAEAAIGKEYAAGRISGYPNGTFRPDAPITRAEAASILNKIFERNYDLVSALQSNDKGNIKFFTDLSTSFWGYNDMVEATNTHSFRRRVKGMVQEDWSEINR
jgi:uncharacterized repeat protein (TIGR02543 family)